jgi:phosphatidylglycerophosphate synthase
MTRSIVKDDPSLLTPWAHRIAHRIIPFLPEWVTPNQITWLCLLVNMLGGVAYFLAGSNRDWLFVAVGCLFFHWVGDNLDGELARARRMTSERGFYLDLILDQVGVTFFALGLAFANYTNTALVLLAIVAYQVLFHLTLMQIVVRGRFSLGRFGPAEGRFGLMGLTLLAYVWPGAVLTIAGTPLGWFDLGVTTATGLALIERLAGAFRLYRELEPPGMKNEK